jgi:hypothetical protein
MHDSFPCFPGKGSIDKANDQAIPHAVRKWHIPRLTRSQRRRSGERSHRRRWLRVKRDNGKRLR